MNTKTVLNKKLLAKLLKEGKTQKEIADITGYSKSNIGYWVTRYNLNNLSLYHKTETFNFNKIDTPEKAYVIGFIICDGHIDEKDIVEISTSIKDKEVIEFISEIINSHVFCDYTFDKKRKKFPRARTSKKIKDVRKFSGGRLKKERHYPIVKKELEPYLMLGMFDADGSITWGRRKDRNRIWHTIRFTSQYKILYGLQKSILNNLGIATAIRPKGNDDCFVLEFSSKNDVLKFSKYIYQDKKFIPLKRKYEKYKALRQELEEFGGNIR